jgi:lysozyme
MGVEHRSRFRVGAKTTAAGAAIIALVAGFEGLRQTVYADPVGIPTVCFGSTKGLTKDMVGKVTFTRPECDALLVEEIVEHEQRVRACLKNPDSLPAGVYEASVSFAFNVGTGAFCASTMKRLLDAANWRAACDQLPKWNKARKLGVLITLPGLTKRRAVERERCLEGLPT